MLNRNSERKTSHERIYPKGYVELLEQQQNQLVSGLQEMYRRLQKASAWHGTPLDISSGRPLTHDLLAALKLLETKNDGSCEVEAFEENCDKLQSRLISEGAGLSRRRGTISSDSEPSHRDQSRTGEVYNIPVHSKPSMLTESFTISSATSSPPTHSSVSGSMQPPQPQQYGPAPLTIELSPLQNSIANTDLQLYSPERAEVLAEMSAPEQMYRTKREMEALDIRSLLSSPWDHSLPQFDWSLFNSHFPVYLEQMGYGMGNGNDFGGAIGLCTLDTPDVDFSTGPSVRYKSQLPQNMSSDQTT